MEIIEKIIGYSLCVNTKNKTIQSLLDAVVLLAIGFLCDLILSFYICWFFGYEGGFDEIFRHIFITYFFIVIVMVISNYGHEDRRVRYKLLNLVLCIDVFKNDKKVKAKLRKILLGDLLLFLAVVGIVYYGLSLKSLKDKLISISDDSLYVFVGFIIVTLVYIVYGKISFLERDNMRRRIWVNTVAIIAWFWLLSYRIRIYIIGAQSEVQFVDAILLVFSAFFIVPNIEKDLDFIKGCFVDSFANDVNQKRVELLERCARQSCDTKKRIDLTKNNVDKFTKVYRKRWKNGEKRRVIIDVLIMMIIIVTFISGYICLIKLGDHIQTIGYNLFNKSL